MTRFVKIASSSQGEKWINPDQVVMLYDDTGIGDGRRTTILLANERVEFVAGSAAETLRLLQR